MYAYVQPCMLSERNITGMAQTLRIDVHAHHYPEEYLDLLAVQKSFDMTRRSDGRRVFRYHGVPVFWVPEPNPSIAERIAQMDEVGVDAQVISLSTPNVYVEDTQESIHMASLTNDIYADIVRSHPKRIRALASLPLGSVAATLEEFEKSLSDPSFDGVVLGTNYRGEYLDSPRLEPVLSALDGAGVPVMLHPVPRREIEGGQDYGLFMSIDFPVDTTISVSRLIHSGTLDRHPNINWILSHGGGVLPFLQGRLDMAYHSNPEASEFARNPPSEYMSKLYYDTACSGHWAALDCLLDTVGVSQVLFGTDFPHRSAGASVDYVNARHFHDSSAHEAILGGNALRLFPKLRNQN